MDEETLKPNAGYAELEADLARLTGAVAAHVQERTARRGG
jgi:hypothetical protein